MEEIKGYKIGDIFWYKYFDGDWDDYLGRYKWRGIYKKGKLISISEFKVESEDYYIDIDDVVSLKEAEILGLTSGKIPDDYTLNKIVKMVLCYDTIKEPYCSCVDYIKKNW